MDLKETIISSFFFHLVLILLVMAVSNYTAGFSGSIQNIVTVDLGTEDSKDQPAARSGPAEAPPPDFSPPSDEKMSLPDQAASDSPAESKIIPEPEKKDEAPAEPVKIEKAEKPPTKAAGFTSLEAYHRFITLHKKIFRQQAGARVNELLGEAFLVNKREFYGGTAIVSLKFATDGKLNEVLVESESPQLKAFLEEIGWGVVPSPAGYSLGFTEVQIQFTVLEGYMNFNIITL